MTDDEVIAQLSDELRAWKGDVEKCKKTLAKVRITKDQLISAISVMDGWLAT